MNGAGLVIVVVVATSVQMHVPEAFPAAPLGKRDIARGSAMHETWFPEFSEVFGVKERRVRRAPAGLCLDVVSRATGGEETILLTVCPAQHYPHEWRAGFASYCFDRSYRITYGEGPADLTTVTMRVRGEEVRAGLVPVQVRGRIRSFFFLVTKPSEVPTAIRLASSADARVREVPLPIAEVCDAEGTSTIGVYASED